MAKGGRALPKRAQEGSLKAHKPQDCAEFSTDELARAFMRAKTPCPEHALAKLHSYVSTLMRWNARMNLVGARTWTTAVEDLVCDCVRLAPFLDRLPLTDEPLCWDPGAGAGLPGIPLRILWQRGDYHMVEVREKRSLFLMQMVASLDLPRTHVHREDIATFMEKAGRPADLVVSRAFLPPDKVLALVKGHLADNALVVFMTNALPDERLCASLGFAPVAALSYPCPAGTRHFWACRRT